MQTWKARTGRIAATLVAGMWLTVQGAYSAPDPQVPPREAMRLHLLDTCVINSSRTNDSSVNYTDRCRCATDRTMRALSEEEIASLEAWGGVAGSVETAFNENWQRCG